MTGTFTKYGSLWTSLPCQKCGHNNRTHNSKLSKIWVLRIRGFGDNWTASTVSAGITTKFSTHRKTVLVQALVLLARTIDLNFEFEHRVVASLHNSGVGHLVKKENWDVSKLKSKFGKIQRHVRVKTVIPWFGLWTEWSFSVKCGFLGTVILRKQF